MIYICVSKEAQKIHKHAIIVPWKRLERQFYPISVMLCIYRLQHRYNLNEITAENAINEITSMQHLVRLSLVKGNMK